VNYLRLTGNWEHHPVKKEERNEWPYEIICNEDAVWYFEPVQQGVRVHFKESCIDTSHHINTGLTLKHSRAVFIASEIVRAAHPSFIKEGGE